MKIIGLSNHTIQPLVEYTISLFENNHPGIIDIQEFKKETHTLATAIKASNLVVIGISDTTLLNTIENWLKIASNTDSFKDTAILLLSTSDQLLPITKEQFLKYGSEVLDTFYLPTIKTTFIPKTGITDIKLSLELIRKVNVIKQNNFASYFKVKISMCGVDNTGFENCDVENY